MSDSVLTSVARTAQAVGDLTRQERPAAAITLTRSATLAIATTGTLITWQTQTRGQGITWSTTDITIPTAGYYLIQVRLATAASVTMPIQVTVNGTAIGYFGNTFVATTYHTGTTMRYHATGDIIQIRLLPSANTTLNQAAENTLTESPFLHIAQLTSVVT